MKTFDEAAHPRQRSGRFTDKTNDAPTGTLTEPAETVKPGGHSISSYAAESRGLTEISAEEYEAREMVPAHDLAKGDIILWESESDAGGTQFWEEEITFAQVGIDLNYRRHVYIETPSARRGIQLPYRSLAAKRPAAAAPAVTYAPELRGGARPEDLAVTVDASDDHGSTVTLHEVGQTTPKMLDRFRITERLAPGTSIPLLESSTQVQEKVADRFIPLDGLSYDEYLRREPLQHGGRAWSD